MHWRKALVIPRTEERSEANTLENTHLTEFHYVWSTLGSPEKSVWWNLESHIQGEKPSRTLVLVLGLASTWNQNQILGLTQVECGQVWFRWGFFFFFLLFCLNKSWVWDLIRAWFRPVLVWFCCAALRTCPPTEAAPRTLPHLTNPFPQRWRMMPPRRCSPLAEAHLCGCL